MRQTAVDGVKKVLRPIWRRVWARIETRVAPIEQRLDRLEVRAEQGGTEAEAAWRQHLPAFLNAVSTVGAFGFQLRRERAESAAALTEFESKLETTRQEIARLWERIEFSRREVLFEVRYGDGASSVPELPSAPVPPIAPRILAPEKLHGDGALRVNLGCGHVPLEGYVNVDARDLPGIDVVADVAALPFDPGSIAAIHAAHLLEHFPQEALRRRLLPYWKSLLAPGGSLCAIVPDGAAMIAEAATGAYPFEDFREVLFGAQDYAQDFHYNLFTPDSLHALLADAGFRQIEVVDRARRNGRCFEFEIVARI